MTINWSTAQLSLRPTNDEARRIAHAFAALWRRTTRVAEELGWQWNPGAVVQLYFDPDAGSAALKVFVSSSKRDRFIVRVTPRPGRLQRVLDALHAAAAALPHPSAVAAAKVKADGNVSIDVVEATTTWEVVVGEDHPDDATVEKRLHAFVGPLLRAIPRA